MVQILTGEILKNRDRDMFILLDNMPWIGIYKNLTSYDKNATGNDHSEAYAKIGLDYPLNEFRACWKMGGHPLGQRLYDKDYSYKAMTELIPSMCQLGLLGHAFTCPDMIGGGLIGAFKEVRKTGNFDQELIVRATQVHALMPMMQFSVAPWRILDKKHLQMVKDATALHTKNADEFVRLAKEAAKTGEPIVRYMEYEFPHQGFEQVKDQFMIGKALLVAPVVAKETYKRKIMFPVGKWLGDDGSIVVGPKTVEVDVPINRLPHYKKQK